MQKHDRNIYLHFFDRELRNSLGKGLHFDDSISCKILSTALMMSKLPLYVSYSHMYESMESFPKSIHMAFECEKYGLLRMLTNKRSANEFIISRQSLYSFDRSRYSYYFGDNEIIWPHNTLVLNDDTTSILKTGVFSSLITQDSLFSFETREKLLSSLTKTQNAVTTSLFRPLLEEEHKLSHISDNQYIKAITDISEIISSQYTTRYLNKLDGTIVTGIWGFSRYDHLAQNAFYTNYGVFHELFMPLFKLKKNYFEYILSIRTSSEFNTLYEITQWIVMSLSVITKQNTSKAIDVIRTHRYNRGTIRCLNEFISYGLSLYNYIDQKYQIGENIKMQTRILIVVATQVELKVLIDEISSVSSVAKTVSDFSYFSCLIGGNLVFIVKSQMGQGGPGGSILTIEEAIRKLSPDYIIMGGVAWGANRSKQSIGDLLISTQVWDYDIERINPDGTISYRGAISPASPRLIQMFETATINASSYNCYYGLVASGSNLYDNIDYVNKLKNEHGEIIGGEMESAGMASVCHREKKDWILVKGICDWGYDKNDHKDEYQRIAASNSMSSIIHLLKQLSL